MPLFTTCSTGRSRTSVASKRPIVAVRAWRVTGRATTATQIWPGLSSGTNSTEPPFNVGSPRSSCQPSRSTMTTRRRSWSKRQPGGGSKQRRTVRVSPAGARARISGDTSVFELGRRRLHPLVEGERAGTVGQHDEQKLEGCARCRNRATDSVPIAKRRTLRVGGEGARGTAKRSRSGATVAAPRQAPTASTGGGPPRETPERGPTTSTCDRADPDRARPRRRPPAPRGGTKRGVKDRISGAVSRPASRSSSAVARSAALSSRKPRLDASVAPGHPCSARSARRSRRRPGAGRRASGRRRVRRRSRSAPPAHRSAGWRHGTPATGRCAPRHRRAPAGSRARP